MKKINKLGTLLLIDYNNVLYKNIFVNQRLTHRGKFTGGLFGFIKQFVACAKTAQPDYVIIAKDAPPYLRKADYPDYKGNRDKDETFILKLEQSKSFVDEFLNIMGVQVEDHKGHEADDVIGDVVRRQFLRFDKIIIKSNDDDLFQLFKYKNVLMERKKKGYYGPDDFEAEYGVTPDQWIEVNALKGSHNNLSGIKGVGIKTALKMMKDQDLYDKYYADWEDVIKRNRKLIRLPYHKLMIPIKDKPNIFSMREMKAFLSSHAIRTNTEEIKQSFIKIYK